MLTLVVLMLEEFRQIKNEKTTNYITLTASSLVILVYFKNKQYQIQKHIFYYIICHLRKEQAETH